MLVFLNIIIIGFFYQFLVRMCHIFHLYKRLEWGVYNFWNVPQTRLSFWWLYTSLEIDLQPFVKYLCLGCQYLWPSDLKHVNTINNERVCTFQVNLNSRIKLSRSVCIWLNLPLNIPVYFLLTLLVNSSPLLPRQRGEDLIINQQGSNSFTDNKWEDTIYYLAPELPHIVIKHCWD